MILQKLWELVAGLARVKILTTEDTEVSREVHRGKPAACRIIRLGLGLALVPSRGRRLLSMPILRLLLAGDGESP
jgi:hypothetical protein